MTREEEIALIQRYQNGDTESFDTLVQMFKTKGYNLAYQWTNNQEDALDVLQEAFIKMHKIIPKWQPKSSLFTWLYRVIVNQAIDLKRRKMRTRLVSTDGATDGQSLTAELPASELAWPDRQVVANELGDNIYEAVMKLPRRQKEVFMLKHYQSLSLREIAEMLECSIGTVKANLFQAVRKLRDQLAELRKDVVNSNG